MEEPVKKKLERYKGKEGHEVRGLMIRLYPDMEQVARLHEIQDQTKKIWNWLVKQRTEVNEAREAYTEKNSLVRPRPVRPDYEALENAPTIIPTCPVCTKKAKITKAVKSLLCVHHAERNAQAKAMSEAYGKDIVKWKFEVHAASKKVPGLEYREFKELLAAYGHKHEYQLFNQVFSWYQDEDAPTKRPSKGIFRAVCLNYFSNKHTRSKKFRRATDSMPVQTREGHCFKLGNFGPRDHARHQEGPRKNFYDCQVSIAGLKVRGRLPGKAPEGRVLEGVSITELADGWWASIKQEVPVRVQPAPKPGTVIGLDAGLNNLIAASDKAFVVKQSYTPPGPEGKPVTAVRVTDLIVNTRGKEHLNRLAELQELGKQDQANRLHLQAARRVKHLLHNANRCLAEYETIKVEKLPANIGQRGVPIVSAMRTATKMLRDRYGDIRVRQVPAEYTSQTCSNASCGHVSKVSWDIAHTIGVCPKCGFSAHRDVNAARNIAARDPIEWSDDEETPATARKAGNKASRKPKSKNQTEVPEAPENVTAREPLCNAAE